MIVPVLQDEELVRDFHTADNVTGALHLWWLGHSGFLIKWNGHGILFDPLLSDAVARKYEGTSDAIELLTERVVDPLMLAGVEWIVISQLDDDHFDTETILALRSANPHAKLVLPAGCEAEAEKRLGPASPPFVPLDAGGYAECGPFELHGIQAANPEIETDSEGHSLDLGYVALFGPFAVYHPGDTGWHTTLVKEVRRWPLNLAFLPINRTDEDEAVRGGNLSGFQAAALAKAISAGLAIPCHYDMIDRDNPNPRRPPRRFPPRASGPSIHRLPPSSPAASPCGGSHDDRSGEAASA